MAIGARITSTNLSGKTATVTFVPYTGSTSGSSINLGEQTIPFNNITTHPYGVYSLYFAEYDYTYTLTIPEPETSIESLTYLAQLSGSTNYGAALLNFTDLTATVLDLGVDSSVWNKNELYPIQDKGYAYFFQDNSNSNIHLIIFTNIQNEIVGQYSGDTQGNYSYDYVYGKWVYFADENAGIVKYFDGENLYTYEYDANTYTFDVEWNNDATTSDGTMIFTLNNGPLYTSYLVSNLGVVTQLHTWDASVVGYSYYQSVTHNFIPRLDYDLSNSIYTGLTFFETDGTEITSIDLTTTADTYNNYNYRQYGQNRYVVVFYNNSDINVPYRIIHFDGETQSIIDDTHARGSNYSEFNISSDDIFGNFEEIPTSLLIEFYDGYNWSNIGRVINTYLDVKYMYGPQTGFTSYTFAENESGKTIGWFYVLTKIFTVIVDNGNMKMLSLTSTGATITDLNYLSTDCNGWDLFNINEAGVVITLWNQTYDIMNLYQIVTPGTIEDLLVYPLNGQWNRNERSGNGYFYVSNYTNGYYVNTTTNGFTEISTYNNEYDSFFYNPSGLDTDLLLLVNSDTMNVRFLSSTTISDDIALPSNNGSWDIRVGANHMMYTYLDGDGFMNIKLYDRTLTLVNSLTTSYTGWDNTYFIKNRATVSVGDGNGDYIIYLISPTTIESVTMADNGNYRAPNDFIWWWD